MSVIRGRGAVTEIQCQSTIYIGKREGTSTNDEFDDAMGEAIPGEGVVKHEATQT